MKKVIALLLVLCMLLVCLAGCSIQSKRVSYNLSKEADNFNITRRLVVINARTDKPVLEVIGNLSVLKDGGDLDIIIEVAPGQYKKHFVNLNEWTIYAVEDISGSGVSPYHYEINFLPEMLVPIEFTSSY